MLKRQTNLVNENKNGKRHKSETPSSSVSLRVPTRWDAAIHFFFPLSQRGIEGDFFICHYPAAKPGVCLGDRVIKYFLNNMGIQYWQLFVWFADYNCQKNL